MILIDAAVARAAGEPVAHRSRVLALSTILIFLSSSPFSQQRRPVGHRRGGDAGGLPARADGPAAGAEGRVRVRGEIWTARSADTLAAGRRCASAA